LGVRDGSFCSDTGFCFLRHAYDTRLNEWGEVMDLIWDLTRFFVCAFVLMISSLPKYFQIDTNFYKLLALSHTLPPFPCQSPTLFYSLEAA